MTAYDDGRNVDPRPAMEDTVDTIAAPTPATPPQRGFLAFCRRMGPAGPLAVAVSTVPPIGGLIVISLTPVIAPYLRSHTVNGSLAFFVLGILVIGLALAPTTSTSILAGWAFGFPWGFTLAMLTLTAAGVFAYGFVRLIARDRLICIIRERPKWNAVYEALLGQNALRALWIVTLLRVPPLAPYAMANFVFGAVKVPFPIYFLGTVLGMIPRTAAATFAAAQLEQIAFEDVGPPWMRITGIVLSVAITVYIGVLAKQAVNRATRQA